MRIFYKFVLSSILSACVTCLFAQSNYRPGYIITSKGDTIKGLLDYREWDSNPKSIAFKNNASEGKPTTYTPDDLKGFEVSGLESYVVYSGPVSMDPTDPNKLTEGRDTSFLNETVFLKALEIGTRVRLYSFTDATKTRFFISSGNSTQIKELIYRVYYDLAKATAGRTVNETGYKTQLFDYIQQYNLINDDLIREIQGADYEKTQLLHIVSRINGISKEEYRKKYSNKTATFLFVGAGANFTNFKPSEGGGLKAGGATPSSSVTPNISVGADFYANANTGKLIFRLEAIAGTNKYTSKYNNKVIPYIPVVYSFNQLYYGMVPQLIYNFYSTPNFKVFAGAGWGLRFFNYSNAKFQSQDQKTQAAQITSYAFDSFYKYNSAIIGKVGIQFTKNLSIYASYIVQEQVSGDPYFQIDYSTLQAGLNYSFR